MPPRIDDRWLWLGFGVFFFIAFRGIRYALIDIARLTELERYPEESNDEKKDVRPEDQISLEDLKTLTESPNPNTANAAIQLILSRFVRQPNAYHSVIKNIDSKDEMTRTRARQALTFLRNWPLMSDFPDFDLPRYSPFSSRSGSTSPSLPSLENIRSFVEVSGNGWADPTASASADTGIVIPSMDNPVAGWTNVPRERPTESEAERRRRRREAMVFREGDGGVEEADIIRPNLDS